MKKARILFRGMSIHGGRVYGHYVYSSVFSNKNDYFKHVIITKDGYKEVDPETVGGCVGVLDKNLKRIHEGDIVIGSRENVSIVYYDSDYLGYKLRSVDTGRIKDLDYYGPLTIIGNITENNEPFIS